MGEVIQSVARVAVPSASTKAEDEDDDEEDDQEDEEEEDDDVHDAASVATDTWLLGEGTRSAVIPAPINEEEEDDEEDDKKDDKKDDVNRGHSQ